MLRKFTLLFWVLLACHTFAAETFKDQRHTVTLLSGYKSTGSLSAVTMGLHYTFTEQWKTYWRYAGTAGYPVKINTQGSKNVKSVSISWPMPQEFVVLKLKSYGYGHDVVLPLNVVLEEPGKDAYVNLKLDYLVCDPGDCVRVETTLSYLLPARSAQGELKTEPSSDFDLIKKYLERVPRPDTGEGMTIDRVELDDSPENYQILTVYARNSQKFTKPVLFIEPHTDVYIDFPEVELKDLGTVAKIAAKVYANELKKEAPKESLLYREVTFVLEDGDVAIESNRLVAELASGWGWFFVVLLFAFIGGFILNFMPCVLPVILIKVFSVLQQTGISRTQVRVNFLLTVAGILTSFLAIALLTVIFREFGFAVGWGNQFQEPIFLVAIMLVILLFAYNLLGWFEILVSSTVATKLTEIETRESAFTHFFSGAFVTILATPCTAPFLGTALSFALSRTSADIIIMFFVMGLGLALPFLMLAVFPGMVDYLPRPGRWMLTFKKLLSLLLFATLVWLLWTLSAIKGTTVVFALIVLFALVGVVLYLKHRGTLAPKLSWTLVLLLSLATLSTPYVFETQARERSLEGTVWVKFDEAKIKEYVAQGKVVFVDVTADWCLTCKANELFVLNTEEVLSLFSSGDVIAMQADWTDGDKTITAFLKRFGKFGVPFYAVYGPKKPDGMPLPEVLTTTIVKDAITKARKQ